MNDITITNAQAYIIGREIGRALVLGIEMIINPPSSNLITDKLTNREVEVIRLIARGLANKDIASWLLLSDGAVRNYTSTIIKKLNVSNRTQVAVIAVQHGLGATVGEVLARNELREES